MNPEEYARLYTVIDELNEKDREIEVLTQERDNALLRIDQLEADNQYLSNAVIQLQVDPSSRGGVHPNA